jgi:saccharopine dehydrogenase (NAD+, L-lysine forming)
MSEIEVAVIGAAGARAQAMFEIAGRPGAVGSWLAADRHWPGSERHACERLGMPIAEVDLLEEPERLRELIRGAALVVNFAGPYYRTGAAVLEACIEVGCDYLDICDDAAATREMLARDETARAAGVRALVGMGASPGISNVLVRAAAEWLGDADEVSLSWVVDVADVNDAALQHFWHTFALTGADGRPGPMPAWEELSLRTASFPEPLGERLLIGLAHPEQVTVPRFLDIEAVRSFGSIAPEDSLVVNWALARMGAAGDEGDGSRTGGSEAEISAPALELYRRYLETRAPTEYLGCGLVLDVWAGEEGVRFASAGRTSMNEATGVPAAAGIALMLEGGPDEAGVIAPECLDPAEFFRYLGRFSRGTGSLGAYRLWGSEEGVRIGIRDLLMTRTH